MQDLLRSSTQYGGQALLFDLDNSLPYFQRFLDLSILEIDVTPVAVHVQDFVAVPACIHVTINLTSIS